MNFKLQKYAIKRYDLSKDKSLRAWSAADEHLIQAFLDAETSPKQLALYNDRFGYLACHLHAFLPRVILTQKSQEKAIHANLEKHDLSALTYASPLVTFEKPIDCALLKAPKSVSLFRLFLEQIHQNSSDEVQVIVGFMTRHFTPKLIQIAGEYFENIEQSKAVKKSRVLFLNKKKQPPPTKLIHAIPYQDQVYQQYLGVFSANHIDFATQFFLTHLQVKQDEKRILDLASGNGVIAHAIQQQVPTAEFHLMDDSILAVASAQLNLQGENVFHHWNNDLTIFESEYFDLIVSNPPFHFEYEINIQVPLHLFKACFRCLKKGGLFQLVANQHLNYKTHLERLFSSVHILAENKKFVVYRCEK